MAITLAMAWNPRGELARLQRYMPVLTALYDHIVISLTPDAGLDSILIPLDALPVNYFITEKWGSGRYLCLQKALDTNPDTIHYVDADRLIRWVELRESELRQTVQFIQQHDSVVIGRTGAAWDTHPRCMFDTEKIINDTFSTLLGQPLDFGAGSKGYSRRAAECILRNASIDDAFDMDVGWTVVLHRAGYAIVDLRVDGMDWETADRDRDTAADDETRRQLAEEWDNDGAIWASRVLVADKIIRAGMIALTKPLFTINSCNPYPTVAGR